MNTRSLLYFQYGYRLPETDEGMLYYQIFFRPLAHTLFTYPECCVRLHDALTFNASNSTEIMEQFLKDIHTKIPVLCGRKLQFQPQAMYTVPKLLQVNQVNVELFKFFNLKFYFLYYICFQSKYFVEFY